jgi:hypothetical protein
MIKLQASKLKLNNEKDAGFNRVKVHLNFHEFFIYFCHVFMMYLEPEMQNESAEARAIHFPELDMNEK